jgi:hypothetical protein
LTRLGEIVLVKVQPLAGRTIVVKFEIGLMIVQQIDADTDGKVMHEKNK